MAGYLVNVNIRSSIGKDRQSSPFAFHDMVSFD